MNIVALIPARANSKRIPGKNTRNLAGHPLISYTLAAAFQSRVFDEVVVASDSANILELAHALHPTVIRNQRNYSQDNEPDIHWVDRIVHHIGQTWDAFAILRPTSPFRTAETINRAWREFLPQEDGGYWGWDSLRAVEQTAQHPGKMWTINDCGLVPLLLQPTGTPWHSSPTQTLPKVYVQNASLEIAWTETVRRTGTIAGDRILAFETQGWEGVDLNTEDDWHYAEWLIETGQATLPEVG